MNPLTRVPHPNEEDSTTYMNQSTWSRGQLLHQQVDFFMN